jgi:hypothetical protein
MRHLPNPIQRIFEKRASLTVVVVAVASAIMAPLDLGWRQLQILGYVALAALVVEFWLDSMRQRTRLGEVEDERDEALTEAKDAEEIAARVPQLEAELLAAESDRDELQQKIRSPQLSLEEVLAALDTHIGWAGLTAKHRELQAEGIGAQWPVTSIQLREAESVLIVAHIDEHAERFAAEWVALIDPAGTVLVGGQITGATDHQLNVLVNLAYFPEYLQEQLLADQSLPPAGHVIRLIGLTLPVYAAMTDEQLQEFGDGVRAASRAISRCLNPEGEKQLVLEEGEATDD